MEEAGGISFINASRFLNNQDSMKVLFVVFCVWHMMPPPKNIADGLGFHPQRLDVFFAAKKKGLWKIGVSAPSMERLDVN